MKATIPCKIVFSVEDDCWEVESLGSFDGLITYGDSLEHAKEMAKEAGDGILAARLNRGMDCTIPDKPSDPDWYDIEVDPGLAFALWLRNARTSRNMTLADVAEKMGVKYQVYQKLENPKTANPTLKTLKKLEDIFETELIAI